MRRGVIAGLLLLAAPAPFFPQAASRPESALVQGFEAYRNEDWTSALFFLRQAVASPQVSTDETWYMLIMSEMYAGEYTSAKADCERFERQFALSQYLPYIQYQRGRCLHYLKQNENAILVLSDFCHQNPGNGLYASALYWIAESFFAEYNYEAARGLYERIVIDFPNDAKVGAAQYRLDAIDQRSREEKLLYLLKVTGEENLAAREEYERQLRQYETEDRLGLRQQLEQAESRVAALERELAAVQAENSYLTGRGGAGGVHDVGAQPGSGSSFTTGVAQDYEPDAEVETLKRRARQLQYLLDEQKAGERAE